MSAAVLTQRQLNRALLARQHLLQRATMAPAAMVHHLAGIQAQEPQAPYVALWSHIENFDPFAAGRLVETRKLVRLAVMRGTLHLMTADDALAIRPVVQPVLTRTLMQSSPYGRAVEGIDLDELIAAGRAILEAQPMSVSELGRRLQERWPQYDGPSMAYTVQYRAPLVQLPPRGVWQKSGRAKLTTLEAFVGRPMATDTAPDGLVMRYLAAFGPATVRDAQAWSGLQGLGETFDRLRPRLVTYRDEQGRELFDITDGPSPDPSVPAPVRFLADYDNLGLGHFDRARVVSGKLRWQDAIGNAGLLVDGYIRATWKLQRRPKQAALIIGPVEPFSKAEIAVVEYEAANLLAFLAPDTAHDIVWRPPQA